jgi:hypothetical protein
MKQVLAFFGLAVLLCFSSSAFAQGGKVKITTVGSPMLTVNKTEHNFGTIKKGSDASCVFEVSNTGDQPLIISKCQASCGCTTPKCDTNPIMPGDKTEIAIKYDSNRMGPFTKTVTVSWNSPDNATTPLTIKGEVVE